MTTIDRKFLICAFLFGATGMLLGIVMAMSHNHSQHVTHAHINLLGFVLSAVYGLIHKVWLTDTGNAVLKTTQFLTHVLGTLVITVGLYLLYGGHVAPDKIEPVLGIASITVLVSLLLAFWLFVSTRMN